MYNRGSRPGGGGGGGGGGGFGNNSFNQDGGDGADVSVGVSIMFTLYRLRFNTFSVARLAITMYRIDYIDVLTLLSCLEEGRKNPKLI